MLTSLRLENFKSWRNTGEIELSPITGFFGANSSGKSSLLQSLLLMKQTAKSHDRGNVFYFGDSGSLVDLGDFENTVWSHEAGLPLKLSLGWECTDEIKVSETYGGGKVSEGDVIGFEAVVICEETYSASWPKLLQSKYSLPGIGDFGLLNTADGGMAALTPAGEYAPTGGPRITRRSPGKFYEFPYWARREPGVPFAEPDIHFELPFNFEMLMDGLHYLGPLRANPNRVYARTGARPMDIGPSGEFVVDALLSAQEREMYVQVGPGDFEHNFVRVDVHVANWLQRLGMVHDFRLESVSGNRHLYEVRVRKTRSSPEVLLTDVGFGVSQILPVLTSCFYLPQGSTIIFDQPDIHLHPSVQAGLADVFIEAVEINDVQIIFESHSEHLLRRFQRRVAEEEIDDEEVSLYFCSNEEDGSSRLSYLELDEFGNIANWPIDFFGDQFGEIAAMSDAALRRMKA